MRTFRSMTGLLVGIILLMPMIAPAAGLGRLNILSALGQPLIAEIELISVQMDELSTLSARLATPEAFHQANIQFSPALVGVRMVVERRAGGQPYIRISSTRPVNEPFIDLLVELSWAQGRLVREYTALVDPPAFAPTAAAPAPVVVAPPVVGDTRAIAPAPAATASASAESRPAAPAAKAPVVAARPAGPASDSKEYGPVKRGDTLSKIASSVKHEGVTLEQTLVGLFRSNPDAFAGNMNLLKTGKILRVPEKEQLSATGRTEAAKEVRVQATNWSAYRQKLADSAGAAPAREAKTAASGKITTAVEDKAAGKQSPKEVLKLSKGEPGAASGKAASAQDRTRILEEESTARQKALIEANERIAQLESTIKKMERLIEVKGQTPAAPPPVKGDTAAKAPAAPVPAPKAEPVKEAAKAEPTKDVVKTDPAKDAGKSTDIAKGEQKVPPSADAAKAEPPKSDVVAEQPKPKPKIAPPPPPDLIDQITGEPLYLAGGGGLLALVGGLGYWFVRRRSAAGASTDDIVPKQAPKLAVSAPAAVAASAAAAGADDVDPLAEADLYLNFGRDAQAEEVLKEALEKNPEHAQAKLKLLQIYAGRKDKAEFEKLARNLQTQCRADSEDWLKAAAMGYAFDPENALYDAGKSAPTVAMPAAGNATTSTTDLDFDLELAPAANVTGTDIELEAGKTVIMEPGAFSGMADPGATQDITGDSAVRAALADADFVTVVPDIAFDGPDTSAPVEPDITLDAPTEGAATQVDFAETRVEADAPAGNMIDFNFDVATPSAPAAADAGQAFTHDGTVILSPEKAVASTVEMDMDATAKLDLAMPDNPVTEAPNPNELDAQASSTESAPPMLPEFKLDDINLSLDDNPNTDLLATPAGSVKDDHWYDVQTKFDLAKAYQEMGDKDGAREILNEVIQEGDAAQQAEAKQLLSSLG